MYVYLLNTSPVEQYKETVAKQYIIFSKMFMFESEVFLGYFLEVPIERNLLFVHQMKQIWNVTQSEVVGESECHTAIFYLFKSIHLTNFMISHSCHYITSNEVAIFCNIFLLQIIQMTFQI